MTVHFTTLISAQELAKYVDRPNWVIFDCRHDLADPNAGRNAYAEGHIPGAQFVHLDFDLSGDKINEIGAFCGRHPLPDRENFIGKLRRWGVNNDSQVIAYDAQGGIFASRLWWMLRWVGHRDVAVLDGGIGAWLSQTQPVSTKMVQRKEGTLHEEASLVRQVTAGDVHANIEAARNILVDARSPDRFRGENETLDPVGGHIPGAKNRFFKDNLEGNGLFKSPQQLHAEWSQIIPDPRHAIMQCGSGVTACHNLLALEVAGMSGAALYPGSWSEWCIDPQRPVATGP